MTCPLCCERDCAAAQHYALVRASADDEGNLRIELELLDVAQGQKEKVVLQ